MIRQFEMVPVLEPFPFEDGCLIIYLSDELLTEAGMDVDTVRDDAIKSWDVEGSYQVLAFPEADADQLLNDIADRLRKRIERHLISVAAGYAGLDADTLIKMALAAAQSPPLRRRLYLQVCAIKGASSRLDMLPRIYRVLIKTEFSGWQQDRLWDDVSVYESRIKREACEVARVLPDSLPTPESLAEKPDPYKELVLGNVEGTLAQDEAAAYLAAANA